MMISRQRERISSNLTILMREHNKVASNSPSPVFTASSLASNSSSSSSSSNVCSWNTREKLLGVSGLNPSATSLFDFDREFIEEEVWGAVEESPFSDDYQAQQQQQRSSVSNSSSNSRVDAENSGLLSKWRTGPAPGSSRVNQAPLSRIQLQDTSASTSKPMNVPDWSKILQNPNWTRRSRAAVEDQDDHSDKENDDDQEWVPPHTLAAREHEARIRTSSIVAFSVLEGAGRTLKGRDLSRVRNAVWKQTGYMAV